MSTAGICTPQKSVGQPCVASYECILNSCVQNVCIHKSCLVIYNANTLSPDGIYTINPAGVAFSVYCEMSKGGYTRILNKVCTCSNAMSQNWASFKSGFGSLTDDHWLGMENIRSILNGNTMQLRWEDYSSTMAYATYTGFSIGPETSNYVLSLGNKIDGILDSSETYASFHNGQPFSTLDRVNNPCVDNYGGGGWWYNNCYNFCPTCSTSLVVKLLIK